MLTRYLPNSAECLADSLMRREGLLNDLWSYDYSVVWRGMEMLYELTGEEKYFQYIYQALDSMISPEGVPRGYDREEYNLDYLCIGKELLYLWRKTGESRFRMAAELLRTQLDDQPRTSDGGFWHKQIYPGQMWLDGQHMAIPFYLEEEKHIHHTAEGVTDAAHQLILAYQHTLDPESGLPCHGWDEYRQQIWANPQTGRAAHVWGRAVGWYMTALADSLEMIPEDHAYYPEVRKIFEELSEKLLRTREEGVWLQVLDCPGRTGNYAESSGSCLIDYALLKGTRLGLLPKDMEKPAMDSFLAIQRHFVGRMKDGMWFVAKCCHGAGLGGAAQRDGSFDYYISEKVGSFDLKATGAFIQAACEYQRR